MPNPLEVLSDDKLVFATLDVNLGPSVSSEPVALALFEQGVPLIFVTG